MSSRGSLVKNSAGRYRRGLRDSRVDPLRKQPEKGLDDGKGLSPIVVFALAHRLISTAEFDAMQSRAVAARKPGLGRPATAAAQ